MSVAVSGPRSLYYEICNIRESCPISGCTAEFFFLFVFPVVKWQKRAPARKISKGYGLTFATFLPPPIRCYLSQQFEQAQFSVTTVDLPLKAYLPPRRKRKTVLPVPAAVTGFLSAVSDVEMCCASRVYVESENAFVWHSPKGRHVTAAKFYFFSLFANMFCCERAHQYCMVRNILLAERWNES